MKVRIRVEPNPSTDGELTLILANEEPTAIVPAAGVTFAGPNEPAAQVFPLRPIAILSRTGPSSWSLVPVE